MNDTSETLVEYGINDFTLQANGTSKLYVNRHYHRHIYHCGSEKGWSSVFWFMTTPEDESTWSPQLVVYGDFGAANAQSLPYLQEDVQHGMYDAVLHVGDYAYDLNSRLGRVGEQFMKQIQPIAAYLPYMTCPGNHEERGNFSNYRARFNMPGNFENLWYSFNMGPVHFIAISTEVYYFMEYGLKLLIKQYDWLVQDLEEASSPSNRAIRPWIIIYGHRPMYCSNDNIRRDCTKSSTHTRVGPPLLPQYGLEKLLHKYGVDLAFWGHEHSYERTWPLFDYKVYNGSYEHPYHNPKATVYLTSGSAGCKEETSPFKADKPKWSAFRSTDYGYMRMKIVNRTHLYTEQVSVDQEGEVIDRIWLVKDKHEYKMFVPLVILFNFHLAFCYVSYQPEQVHLAYGENPYEIVVTWSTKNDTSETLVEYGINGFALQANGTSKLFVNIHDHPHRHHNNTREEYIHRVVLPNLTPGSKYVYHCGSKKGWSSMFWFMTTPEDESTWSPQLAIFGDLGAANAQSLPYLQEEVQRGKYDAVLHVGDFAYDMNSKLGRVGEQFMKQIQPIAAYLPYMTCPGNHEEAGFNMGPVHFISISTEVYYFTEYGLKLLIKQYEWLVQDLEEASSPKNRTIRPWIVIYGHRPMYCSNDDHDDCTDFQTYTRIGLPFLHWFGMEKLLYKYGVDLAIWAHEHSYERLWPLYDYKVYNGSYEDPYRNPKATVHLISGSARHYFETFRKSGGCGSNLGWSRFFKFTTLPNEPLQTPRLVIYGDMGADEPEALPYLKTEVQDGIYDAVLHLGDFAYELHSKNGKKFMELVESIAAYVPYMVCPGNHELYMNFKYYRNLFRMPGNFQGLWYSFNLGPAHFISISTEAYYFTYSGIQTVINQYNWLLKDLREATQPENRSKRPWIIIYGHRPMYCSNDNQDDCTRHKTYTRVGIPAYYRNIFIVISSTQYGLEDLLNRFGVDLALWADVHSYERLWPVHDYVVFNGSYEKPYHNPGAPVHINVASAGASYIKGDFQKNTPHWSAFRSMDYGYMRMQIINKTHLYTEQVSVDGT
ncbi:hypothetical protein C0J52_18687 [Blattella germanica]|nr:hypothetical protein C0J52_18687 [Blattella germanica]